MHIRQVTHQQLYRGIPLHKWESVVNALNLFASGGTAGSHETENKQMHDVGQSQGGFAMAFYTVFAPHMRGAGNSFVEEMLAEAKPQVMSRGNWRRSYDYDGMGVFFKTSVEITTLDKKNELYNLEIWAAYVGDKPEEGLSAALGIPRNMLWSNVTVLVTPFDEEFFAFDFEQLLRKLDVILPTGKIKGKDIVKHFMSGDRYNDPKPFVIHTHKDFTVTVGLGRVERRFVYDEPGKARDTWTAHDTVLMGYLDESYEQRGQKEVPSISISIRSSQTDKMGDSLPIWDESKKQAMMYMTDLIVKAVVA